MNSLKVMRTKVNMKEPTLIIVKLSPNSSRRIDAGCGLLVVVCFLFCVAVFSFVLDYVLLGFSCLLPHNSFIFHLRCKFYLYKQIKSVRKLSEVSTYIYNCSFLFAWYFFGRSAPLTPRLVSQQKRFIF